MPLTEEQYLLHVSPEDGSPTAAWPLDPRLVSGC